MADDMQVLMITGASSGIGAATARAAVKAGWRVGLMARSEDKLQSLVDELGGSDVAMALPGDVTELETVRDVTAQLENGFGRIDAVFANAGMGSSAFGTEKGDPEEWEAMVRLNVLGVLWTVKATQPALKKTKGQLILTGSVAGENHMPGSVYGATKWFVHGYGGNMAEEMRDFGGRCTVIAPGMVDTPFFDEAKPDKLQPEDIADTVMFALGQPERAAVRHVTIMPNR